MFSISQFVKTRCLCFSTFLQNAQWHDLATLSHSSLSYNKAAVLRQSAAVRTIWQHCTALFSSFSISPPSLALRQQSTTSVVQLPTVWLLLCHCAIGRGSMMAAVQQAYDPALDKPLRHIIWHALTTVTS